MRKGGAFRLVGLILGIVAIVVSITAIIFSAMGFALSKKVIPPRVRR